MTRRARRLVRKRSFFCRTLNLFLFMILEGIGLIFRQQLFSNTIYCVISRLINIIGVRIRPLWKIWYIVHVCVKILFLFSLSVSINKIIIISTWTNWTPFILVIVYLFLYISIFLNCLRFLANFWFENFELLMPFWLSYFALKFTAIV